MIQTELNRYNASEKIIFDFYSKQQLHFGEKPTFEDIDKKYRTLRLSEFLKFCFDFRVNVEKEEEIKHNP